MFRRALSIYLAFLTMAAPCLCCCTAARVLANEPSTPTDSLPSCCRHDVMPEPTSIPSTPDPQERCPCRDHAEKPIQAASAAAVDLDILRTALRDTIIDAMMIAPPVARSVAVDQSGTRQLREPNLSTADLLHVHHRLRC